MATQEFPDRAEGSVPSEKKTSKKKAKSPKKSKAKSPKKSRAKSPKKSKTTSPKKARAPPKKSGKVTDRGDFPKTGSIKRLVKSFIGIRLSAKAVDKIAIYADNLTGVLVEECVTIAEYGKRKTVQTKDVQTALKRHGIKIYSPVDLKELRSCSEVVRNETAKSARSAKAKASKSALMMAAGENDMAKVLRFDFSDVGCLTFQRKSFIRLARYYSDHYSGDKLRWSMDAITNLQVVIERAILKYIASATAVATAAKKRTVSSDDIDAAHYIAKTHGTIVDPRREREQKE